LHVGLAVFWAVKIFFRQKWLDPLEKIGPYTYVYLCGALIAAALGNLVSDVAGVGYVISLYSSMLLASSFATL